jgi:hypothetical protein
MTARILGVALALCLVAPLGAQVAKGTITYQSKSGPVTVAVKHAFVFKGPDVVTGKMIRRIVLSTVDVGPKLRACANMMCSDGDIQEGMTVDLDAGARLNYWFVANGQKVQYSGVANPSTLKLTTDTPQKVAGRWDLDMQKAGGPVVHVEFDAPIVKELKGK